MDELRRTKRGALFRIGSAALNSKYRALGFDPDAPAPTVEPYHPKLSKAVETRLIQECKAELMAHRGNASMRMNILAKYQALGLDLDKIDAASEQQTTNKPIKNW